jgi:large subunit ribosomal protein L16
MLQPSRIKHSKVHKGGRCKTIASRGTEVSFGSFGLKAEEACWLKANQLESARKVIARYLQRGGKIWIRVFPSKPRTARSPELGMGGGRGPLDHFVAVVEAGRMIFEIDGISPEQAREALKLASYKLPMKTRVVER